MKLTRGVFFCLESLSGFGWYNFSYIKKITRSYFVTKISTKRAKMANCTHQHALWGNFLRQNWFLCEMFFFVYSKRKEKRTPAYGVLFLTYICFVFHQKKVYSWGRTLRGFVMKNSQQIDDVPIFILSIYFSWGMIKKK